MPYLSLSIDYLVILYHYCCRTTYRVIPTLRIAIVIERLMLWLAAVHELFCHTLSPSLRNDLSSDPYLAHHCRYRATHAVLVVIRQLFCHTLSPSLRNNLSSDPYLAYHHRCGATHAVLTAVHELFCHTLSPSLSSDLPSDSCHACRCS